MHASRSSIITLWLGVVCAACADDGATRADTAAQSGVTWAQDIEPLVAEHCLGCHQTGGIAPFAMQQYAEVRPWASAMADAVEQGRMPPFLANETDACQPRLPWARDLRLTPEQKSKLRSWAKAGAPMGQPTAAGAPALERASGKLAREDVVMRLPEPIEVQGQKDIHTCILADPSLDRDRYVTGRQVTAGNARVLHHVVSYVVQPGRNPDGSKRDKQQLEAAIHQRHGVGIGGRWDCFGGPGLPDLNIEMLDAWAPGMLPNLAPHDSGQLIDKDALVVLDTHYHPTGQPEIDTDTRLSLMLADEPPSRISQMILLGNARGHWESDLGVGELLLQPGEDKPEFVIPAFAEDHVEDMTWTWKVPEDAYRIYSAATHMHYVGRDMRVTLTHAQTQDEECLIETPHWDFDWQRTYDYAAEYEALPQMGGSDVVHLRCVYDNTMQNPHVAEALANRGLDRPIDVALGEDTLDEMCITALGLVFPNTHFR